MKYPAATLVPREKRIEVYKKAIKFLYGEEENLKANLDIYDGICLILPVILWDLKNYRDDCPDGTKWKWTDTKKMFPEIKYHLPSIRRGRTENEQRLLRISILERIVEEMESVKE